MKENNTLCGDNVHLSIHDLVSVTESLLKFHESWFNSPLQKVVKQAIKSSVKTDIVIFMLCLKV